MLFHISGSAGIEGTCRLDVQERNDQGSEVKQLYCDVPGYPRIWLKRQAPDKTLNKKKKLFSW